MRRFFYELFESFRIAWAQIRANKMRSILTALGVIIGIIAVTLMGTAILGIDKGVENSLAGFGDDVLYITKWPWRDNSNDWWNYRNRQPISPIYADRINEWVEAHPGGPLSWRCLPPLGAPRLSAPRKSSTNIWINGFGGGLPRASCELT